MKNCVALLTQCAYFFHTHMDIHLTTNIKLQICKEITCGIEALSASVAFPLCT
ncbi:hypothetical protein Hanom_Chr00s141174g01818981 [Helianthus anomalus]